MSFWHIKSSCLSLFWHCLVLPGISADTSMKTAVNSWDAEKYDYDICENKKRGVIGHYTQVVWDKTTHVGCGLQQCSSVSDKNGPMSGFDLIVVCNYWPGGNMKGEIPYNVDRAKCGSAAIGGFSNKMLVVVIVGIATIFTVTL